MGYKRYLYPVILIILLTTICRAQTAVQDSTLAVIPVDSVNADTALLALPSATDTTATATIADTTAAGLQVNGEPVAVTPVKKSPKGAMIRSLILPGWGQFYNGKWFKGIVIGGTEIGLVIDAVIQNQMAVRATEQLEREFYQENRSLAIWWLGAAILYSITDAFVDAHLYDFDASPELSMTIKKANESFEHTGYSVFAMNLAIPLSKKK
ncbi:MAG TPA: DUF5683 domain-containing protein [bacterium]|nr:DUF5683 domain-containing protein [bacterium]HPN42064.1 DUF5683 domain-containing protein [bacterium]